MHYSRINVQGEFIMANNTSDLDEFKTGIPYYFLFVLIIVISAVGNLVIIISFSFIKVLRTIPNYFTLVMAISDFIAGVNLAVQEVFYEVLGVDERMCLAFSICPEMASLSISLGMLLLAIAEWYIAIVRPLQHLQVVTKVRARSAILSVSVYLLILSYLPLFGWNNISAHHPNLTFERSGCEPVLVIPASYAAFLQLCHILPIFIIITFFIIRILFVAHKQSKQIEASIVITGPVPKTRVRSSRKGIYLHMAMVFALAVSLLPYLCVQILLYKWFNLEVVDAKSVTNEPLATMYVVFYGLALSNCVFNPLIYGFGSSTFRKSVKKVLSGFIAKISK